MDWLFAWWDAVELWLVQLWFPLLVTLVLVVVVPLAWVLARVVNRAVDGIGAKLTRLPDAEPPVRTRTKAGRS